MSQEPINVRDGGVVLERPVSPISSQDEFVSGVVEGFYGRPWTFEQRRHLFARLSRLGMNTYVYAPKDDLKHRPQWRVPYNGEETEVLRSLIESAKEKNITFVYSLSPGIDIAYSKIEDRICVKSKLDQVRMLGCNSFALLFDDIECEMNEEDRKCFNSFVSAQVAVTNEVYEYLGRPKFLFCPTEYCESRAVPSLEHSEYLATLGKELHSDVHIMWTGPRVISRQISVEHARKVARVLRRKPLIWDNLHANDYDQKRVFMGDFCGRPVALRKEIAGLLMNPCCKYELNFVPLLTFADWNACSVDPPPTGSTDIVDEGTEDGSRCAYHPRQSLKKAVSLWTDEFNCVTNHVTQATPQPDVKVDGARSSDDAMTAANEETIQSQDSAVHLEEILKAVVIPSPADEEPLAVNSLAADYGEPMETTVTVKKEEVSTDPVSDPCDVVMTDMDGMDALDVEQVSMLIDMFYLPFECGRRASELLGQFSWLYENAILMNGARNEKEIVIEDGAQDEWIRRFDVLQSSIQTVNSIFRNIVECSNKSLVSDLIPYIWDAHGSCSVLLGVARWMKEGFVTKRPRQLPSWINDREDEPWMIGGGFLTECARLVAPTGPITQLFNNRTLLPLSIVNYEVRPYRKCDLDSLIALSITSVDYPNASYTFQKEVFLDKFVMPFLDATPQHCFLAQEIIPSNEAKLISCVSAHPNAQAFFSQMPTLISSLKMKYSELNRDEFDIDDIARWYPKIPEVIFDQYPAWLDARLLVDAYDAMPTKKLVQVAAATLFMSGCSGVFATIPLEHEDHINYLSRIGFSELGKSVDGRFMILGHQLAADEEFRE